MTVFRNCRMEVYKRGEWNEYDCDVRISDARIVVSYKELNRITVYEGPEDGSGHFNLDGQGINGSATLHRFADASELEGWWREDDIEGMWRVRLGEAHQPSLAGDSRSAPIDDTKGEPPDASNQIDDV